KLLDRLYDVARGRVAVDGVDVREWDPQALRRRIAVVLQDVFLFSGSVHANIALGRDDLSREAAETAARHVNAEDFIRRLGGSASCAPLPGPWPTIRTSSSSTRRRRASIPRPSG